MTRASTEAGNSGSYRIVLELTRPARLAAGRLAPTTLPPGIYVYVGSARRHLAQRVARHRRLAETKVGARHWHLDALLLHSRSRLLGTEMHPQVAECELLRATLALPGAWVPVPGFGATDCRAHCPAHLLAFPPGAMPPLAGVAGGGQGGIGTMSSL